MQDSQLVQNPPFSHFEYICTHLHLYKTETRVTRLGTGDFKTKKWVDNIRNNSVDICNISGNLTRISYASKLCACPDRHLVVQADGVLIDLAGETAGMRSNALVDNPLEPRLFVYRRDGSALELLRNNDVKRWRDQFLLESPAARQGRRGGKERVGRKDAIAPHLSVSVREEQCWVDPHALEARQVL